MKSIFKYPEIIDAFIESLFRNTEKYDEEIGEKFFIQRVQDSEFLESRLSNANEYGGNVLVVGEPGIGKSSFLTWFLKTWQKKQGPTCNQMSLLDLRQTPFNHDNPNDFLLLIAARISQVVKDHIKYLIKTGSLESSHIIGLEEADFYSTLVRLSELPKPSRNPRVAHYLFVDDVDYLPSSTFVQFLELLKPLLLSRYFCVILACRVPAHNTIKSHRDFNICRAFEDSTTVDLKPIPVHAILQARFSILTKDGRSLRGALPNLKWIARGLASLFNTLESTVAMIEGSDDIELFTYPFTERQHAFMREMSNGNIRIILQIAKEYLSYMRNNEQSIKVMEQGYYVGRPAVVAHFSDKKLDEKVRLVNLHEKKTHQYSRVSAIKKKGVPDEAVGNSVYVLVLEAYKEFAMPNHLDPAYIRVLIDDYGLEEGVFYEATQNLVEYEMLRERCLEARSPMGVKPGMKDYDLTDKGRYYLDYLIHWDAYIKEYGVSKHHELTRAIDSRRRLESGLVLFIGDVYAWRLKNLRVGDDFVIDKNAFRDAFVKFNSDLLMQIDETDKNTKPKLSAMELSVYLEERLRLSRKSKAPRDSFFFFVGSDVMNHLREQGYFSCEVRGFYDLNAFGKFVTTFAIGIKDFKSAK